MQALDTWQEDNDNTWSEPLSRAQAQALLRARPGVSPQAVVGLQLAVTLAAGLLGWLLGGRAAGMSAAWGGAVVLLPAALFAAGMRRWLVRLPPAYALFGFAFGELLKIAATLALLLLAPRLLGGRAVGLSALWGGGVVLLPAALFAGAMRRWLVRLAPAYALFGFAFGELLKIALTVVLLLLAPRVLPEPNWPALLLGLAATLQVYWIALLLRGKPRRSGKQA